MYIIVVVKWFDGCIIMLGSDGSSFVGWVVYGLYVLEFYRVVDGGRY